MEAESSTGPLSAFHCSPAKLRSHSKAIAAHSEENYGTSNIKVHQIKAAIVMHVISALVRADCPVQLTGFPLLVYRNKHSQLCRGEAVDPQPYSGCSQPSL